MGEKTAVDTGFQGLQQGQPLAADHVLCVSPLPMEHLVRGDADEYQQNQYDAEDKVRRQVEFFATDDLHALLVEFVFLFLTALLRLD
jgi:hypothetical protein